MKRMITAVLFILIITFNYAQEASVNLTTHPIKRDNYLQKAKKFNTAGWTCLGGGSALTVAGLLCFPKDYNIFFESESRDNSAAFATTLVIAVAAAIITSIPMFANAALFRHKAKLSVSNAPQSFNLLKGGNNMAAISLSIWLGKH